MNINSIGVQDVSQKVILHREDREEVKKNLYYLMIILMGLDGTDLLAEKAGIVKRKIELNQALYDKQMIQIDSSLKDLKELLTRLQNDSGSTGSSLNPKEYEEIKAELVKLQQKFQIDFTKAGIRHKQFEEIAQFNALPLEEMKEVSENLSVFLIRLFQKQYGNLSKF